MGCLDKFAKDVKVSLHSAFLFNQQCERSDVELRKVFGNTENVVEDKQIKDEPITEPIDFDLLKPKIEIEMDAEEFLEGVEATDDLEETELEIPHRRRGRKKLTNDFPCDNCGKIFDKLYRLQRHLNVHNSEGKPFECTICYQRFVREDLLIRHRIKHSELMSKNFNSEDIKEIYKCSECDRVFRKQESLSAHMQKHKNEEPQSYECTECERTFTKASHLSRHMKIHGNVKPHKCQLCPKSFALGGQLIDHMNKHNGIKPHVCPECGKGFQQSCTLKDHLRTHSGEAPFLCSECGKAFNNSSNLRQHLVRHSGLKPFACSQCPSRFASKGGLTSHEVTHTGAKPYIVIHAAQVLQNPIVLLSINVFIQERNLMHVKYVR
ncbi:zinc finger protein 501-like [Ctenocephalides felis]|uniref:zinc finger protein 501-like n=1 Tax=Ctenocephalides felis TaxID=7515 RepID=UPI000E6E10CE|nr:zinc finger protein 501-like [Ctenocephalides felis]